MICKYAHIKLGKRAGWGHDPTGMAGTAPGELAIECRAYPLPGKNLPNDWANVLKEFACVANNLNVS